MVPKTTRQKNDTPVLGRLYLALELSEGEWKLGITVGLGQAPRLRNIPARNLVGLKREIEQAKERFGLPAEAEVVSCYEAGRDGFWLHRYLESIGVHNVVVELGQHRSEPAFSAGENGSAGCRQTAEYVGSL